MMDESCIFKFRYGQECDDSVKTSCNRGNARVYSIIKASRNYGDALCVQLEEQLATNEELHIHFHKTCVSRYASITNIGKHKLDDDDSHTSTKYQRPNTFDFRKHCLYCGKVCDTEKDYRHPDRWRPSYLCRTTHSLKHDESGKYPYKDNLVDKCNARADAWGTEVRARLDRCVSDLHAADARYHKDCMSKFICNTSIKPESPSTSTVDGDGLALNHVMDIMLNDKTRIWNSIQLYQEYIDHSGSTLSRTGLVDQLYTHFNGEVLVLSSPGYANIITFNNNALVNLKSLKDDDVNEMSHCVKYVAKQIVTECKTMSYDKNTYMKHINTDLAAESVSPTLQLLLTAVSQKLNMTLPALMIGNIVTSVVINKPTHLQVALGILLRDSKSVINHMYDYRVTCNYNEVLRFKKSAAVAAVVDTQLQGIKSADHGLVQVVADNFDADIACPNGKLSTHSLAMIVTQPSHSDMGNEVETIDRLSKAEMSRSIEDEQSDELPHMEFHSKPLMPEKPEPNLHGDLQTIQDVASARAGENDVGFIQDILSKEKCPEFLGYNTKLCRDQGHTQKQKTKVVYLPLIDKPPADPATMATAMLKAKRVSTEVGQEYVIFTADQQLYKVALHVIWQYPDQFSNTYLRLGGMHLLMSYIGSIGTLMAETGIAEVLASTFGGVLKMLSGKKYPDNVRALRMLTEEVLRPVFDRYDIECMEDLQRVLDDISSKSNTAKLWIDCLVKPIFCVLKYIRAEREADWALHLVTVSEMMPLFFAARHINYARYGTYYLRSMQAMPDVVRSHFMQGQHTMHHIPGVFNGIWSDMAIETTFMRYGHSRGGIIGITLKPESVKTWAYSLHMCNSLTTDLNAMRQNCCQTNQTEHKEEMPSRILADDKDRHNIRDKLELSIDPLDPEQHHDGLVNIVTVKVVTHSSVNVHNAVDLGNTQMESFEQCWPNGFHNPIPKIVNTMSSTRKHIRLDDKKVFDTETIYARAMGLQRSARNLDINHLLSHELAPQPTSMFDDCGHMREAKTKSNLKKALEVDVSGRRVLSDVTVTFLDGCAVLWVVPWPASGIVQNYLDRFRTHITNHMRKTDVYLVFDKYREGSTKESTRQGRDQGASRVYSLRGTTRLPPQKSALTVSTNKSQLISLICADLIEHKDELPSSHKLTITASDATPVELTHGMIIRRTDMKTTQEEADTIIVQQLVNAGAQTALVVADDTDIFVLLLHFVSSGDITWPVMMMSPIHGRTVIDINATVLKHQAIIPDLLAAHGATGCDTVATLFGIGKGVTLKILRAGTHHLNYLGDVAKPLPDVEDQVEHFILACYGQSRCRSMTEARVKVWSTKVGNSMAAGAPKAQTLPPTNEAFCENVARAHLQVAIWRNALELDPPALDPTTHGWSKDDSSNCLTPTTVPTGTPLAPAELLKLLKCSCSSEQACNSRRCGCTNNHLACTMFCDCEGGNGCYNELTIQVQHFEDDDSD